jgi:hypothetical protein
MRLWLCLMLLVPAPVASWGEPPAERVAAGSLAVVEPAYRGPRIDVALSNPPRFDAVFERAMPTTGWRLVVDDVQVDGEQHRIVVRISEIPPEGNVAQVVTDTECRVPLGPLSRGTWSLELRVRRADAKRYRPAHAIVLRAGR